MIRAAVPIVLLTAAAACAGGRPPSGFSPSGVTLRYATEEPLSAAYAFSDTTVFAIEAGAMGTMRVLSAQRGTAAVSLRDGADGLVATVMVTEYDGRFENPNQGATRAGAGDIRGAWVIRLAPDGGVAVVDSPALTPAAREVAGGQSLVRPLFVHLAGAVAPVGTSWVDTVSLTERTPDLVSRSRSIVRSTLTGDTLLAGRRLAVIRLESTTDLEVEGTSGGVEILQRLDGTIRGTVLWDPALGVLVERAEAGQLEGTLELPGMGFGAMPVTARVRRAVSLAPAPTDPPTTRP